MQVWDGVNGVLCSTFNQHAADIRCVTASPDEDMVFASGTDSRVICLRRLHSHGQEGGGGSSRWVYSTAHRPHSHDVLSLAICSTAEGPKLISGGLDAKVCSYSLAEFDQCRPSWILPVPATGIVSSDVSCSVMTVAHRTHIDLWKLRPGGEGVGGALVGNAGSQGGDDGTSSSPVKKSKKRKLAKDVSCRAETNSDPAQLLGRLSLKGTAHIKQATLSCDGTLLAVASSSGIRLWRVECRPSSGSVFTKLASGELQTLACHAVAFSPDGRRLAVACCGGRILLGNLATDTDDAEESVFSRVHVFDHRSVVEQNRSTGDSASAAGVSLESAVKSLSFSPDGRWMAVASSGKRVYVYDIDRFRIEWVLPEFSSPISHMSFSPHNLLTVILADNSFMMFDAQQHQMSSLSKHLSKAIPEDVKSLPGPLEGVAYDDENRDRVFLYGQGFCLFVDLKLEVPVKPNVVSAMDGISNADHSSMKKKKKIKSDKIQNSNFTLFTQYRSIVSVAIASGSELV